MPTDQPTTETEVAEYMLSESPARRAQRTAQDASDQPGNGAAFARIGVPPREYSSRSGEGRISRLPRSVLRRTLRYVASNLDGKLTWEEIASAVGMDPFRLGRGFKLSTGMTLHQYVTRSRLRRARLLLAHGRLSLADIALEVGFSCQSHLTTLFHKHTGTTPGAFRRASHPGTTRLEPAGSRLDPTGASRPSPRHSPTADRVCSVRSASGPQQADAR
jgi:AraC-like DNA-binding protein